MTKTEANLIFRHLKEAHTTINDALVGLHYVHEHFLGKALAPAELSGMEPKNERIEQARATLRLEIAKLETANEKHVWPVLDSASLEVTK